MMKGVIYPKGSNRQAVSDKIILLMHLELAGGNETTKKNVSARRSHIMPKAELTSSRVTESALP